MHHQETHSAFRAGVTTSMCYHFNVLPLQVYLILSSSCLLTFELALMISILIEVSWVQEDDCNWGGGGGGGVGGGGGKSLYIATYVMLK